MISGGNDAAGRRMLLAPRSALSFLCAAAPPYSNVTTPREVRIYEVPPEASKASAPSPVADQGAHPHTCCYEAALEEPGTYPAIYNGVRATTVTKKAGLPSTGRPSNLSRNGAGKRVMQDGSLVQLV